MQWFQEHFWVIPPGLLALFEVIDGVTARFARTRSLLAWIRGQCRKLLSPWRSLATVQETVARIERHVEVLENRLTLTVQPTELYRGVRWAHVRREAKNGAFCEACFQSSGQRELYPMRAGIVNAELGQWIMCPKDDRHCFYLPSQDYAFGQKMKIGGTN